MLLNTYGPLIGAFRGRLKAARKSPGWRGGGNPEAFTKREGGLTRLCQMVLLEKARRD